MKRSKSVAVLAMIGVVLTFGASERARAGGPSQLIATQQAQLVAGDAVGNDRYGFGVALDGDTALVAAPLHPGTISFQGAVYVLVRVGSNWIQQAKLVAPDAGPGDDAFGLAVALDGDTAVVGCPYEDNAGLSDAGAVYVFVRSGTTWSLQQKLAAADPGPQENFGWSVAIDGDTIVTGATQDDHSSQLNPGAAYVFVRGGTVWTQQKKLIASDPGTNDQFGVAVSISGNSAIVGAFWDDHPGLTDSGSAYVFVRSGAAWSHQAKLTASDGGSSHWFGEACSISQNTAIVGATRGGCCGQAYTYVRTGTAWSQQAILAPPDPLGNDRFGRSTVLNGDVALIGAHAHDLLGMNAAGAAYVFIRSGTAWSSRAKLTASDAAVSDVFGESVALSGDTAIAGAWSHGGPTGSEAGAAYVFVLSADWSDLGFGLPGVAGIPVLAGEGSLIVGTPGYIVLTSAAPSAPALLLASTSSVPTTFLGGTLLAIPFVVAVPLTTSASGTLLLPWPAWPTGLPSSTPLYFQYIVQDAAAIHGAAISNALSVEVP